MLDLQCHQFIHSPYRLWETDLTSALVNYKWSQLGLSSDTYSTTNAWHKKQLIYTTGEPIISIKNQQVLLEEPDQIHLLPFYQANRLEIMDVNEVNLIDAQQQLYAALSMLNTVGTCGECVALLVKAIQVLKPPAPEYDVSYSHPDIPFSIFVSVDTEQTQSTTLRLAESILHEAMHLKLSLIEEYLPVILPGSRATFHSPWRNEQRPIRGVLHGVFVFRAILDFYKDLMSRLKEPMLIDFVDYRIEIIHQEFATIEKLPSATGFTAAGRQLGLKLLQY